MASYSEQIAQWRQQRAQRDVQYRVDTIRQEYRQLQQERDAAIADNDLETAELRDYDCERLEQEYREIVPQQPQIPQGALRWAQRNPKFFERFGINASEAVDKVLAYMVRPKNPNTNNPVYSGMGMRPDQIFDEKGLFRPAARDAMETLLQMHGPTFLGVSYDPGEKTPTWQSAAKASGLSEKGYLAAYNELKRQGRVS